MKLLDRRAASVLFTALVFGLGLLFVYAAWRALVAFIFAIFFAYLLEEPVSWLQTRLRNSRMWAITVTYLVIFGVIAAVLAWAAPRIVQEAQTLSQQFPSLMQKVSSGQIAYEVGGSRGWSQETERKVQSFLVHHRDDILVAARHMGTRAAELASNAWWLLLVPILAIFFLKDGKQFGQGLIAFAASTSHSDNPRAQRVAHLVIDEMNQMLGHFIRAQLLLAIMAMIVITLGLWAMKVPYGFAVGPAAGALEFIPVVGPLLGGVLVMGVAFVANYQHLIWLLVFLLVWRGVQDYVNSPKIMGNKLELHPLAILFGVLAGGEAAGVIGVFLSIPILAALRIIWRAWRFSQRLDEPLPVAPTDRAA